MERSIGSRPPLENLSCLDALQIAFRVLGFTCLISLVVTAFMGFIPVLSAPQTNLSTSLEEDM
ncbi:MAG: hypothetical protein M2R45_04333 [Verrucomicrobia subdivision 3 bacterium]|nr:hypothetical protein [Limisphaerales bacterium]MCS1416037.1 hypothetical protein [Limisphaerales bacterium]